MFLTVLAIAAVGLVIYDCFTSSDGGSGGRTSDTPTERAALVLPYSRPPFSLPPAPDQQRPDDKNSTPAARRPSDVGPHVLLSKAGGWTPRSHPSSVSDLVAYGVSTLRDELPTDIEDLLLAAHSAYQAGCRYMSTTRKENVFVEFARAAAIIRYCIPNHPHYAKKLHPKTRNSWARFAANLVDNLATRATLLQAEYRTWWLSQVPRPAPWRYEWAQLNENTITSQLLRDILTSPAYSARRPQAPTRDLSGLASALCSTSRSNDDKFLRCGCGDVRTPLAVATGTQAKVDRPAHSWEIGRAIPYERDCSDGSENDSGDAGCEVVLDIEASAEPGAKLRAMASKHAELRSANETKAKAAFKKGRKSEGNRLRQLARQDSMAVDSYNKQAAAEIFKHHNPRMARQVGGEEEDESEAQRRLTRCDLHGLRVPEAEAYAEKYLRRCKNAKMKQVVFITGQGKRSKDGVPKIRPAITKLLETRGLVPILDGQNPGRIAADLGCL